MKEKSNKPSKEKFIVEYKGYTIIPYINSYILFETEEKYNTLRDIKNRINKIIRGL